MNDSARQALREARVMLLFTPALCKGDPRETLQAALAAGVDAVQFRVKIPVHVATVAEALRTGAWVWEVCRERGVPLLVNDRVDWALALEADGVHLGWEDMPPATARSLLGADAIIGISTHNERELAAALAARAEYVGAGQMFPSGTKDTGALTGPAYLAQVHRTTDVPAFAIGGIAPDRLPTLRDATPGPVRVAVSGFVLSHENPGQAVRELLAALG